MLWMLWMFWMLWNGQKATEARPPALLAKVYAFLLLGSDEVPVPPD